MAGGGINTTNNTKLKKSTDPKVNTITNMMSQQNRGIGTSVSKGDPKQSEPQNDLQIILQEIRELRKDNEAMRNVLTDICDFKKEFSTQILLLKTDNELLKDRVKSLELRDERREKELRANNFVIRGLQGVSEKHEVENFLATELEVVDEVAELRSFGREATMKTLVVSMATAEGKKNVMKIKAMKLRGTKISISHDRTPKEREIQQKLRELAAGYSEKGKQVRIGYKKVTVDGSLFVWDDDKGLVESIRDRGRSSSVSNRAT